MSLWSFIANQLQTNQFTQAAVLAAPATALTYSLRAIPTKIYHGVRKLISVDVRFNSDMPEWESIVRYITDNVVRSKWSRNFVYEAEKKWDEVDYTSEVKHHGLTAGYGTHIGFYHGHFVMIDRFLDEASTTETFKEHMVLTFFTRSKKVCEEFSMEIARAAGNNIGAFENVPIHINNGNWWERMGKLPLRRMASVFSANNAGERLVDAIRAFDARRDEDHRLGVPHHLGIMLHGEPGCGKSSLIHAAASELERSIYYLNLGSVEKDKELTSLLSGTRDWSKIILAIEDVDAAGVKVSRGAGNREMISGVLPDGSEVLVPADADDKAEKSPVSLSALLNVLDGILCPDGLVVIATTNHYDRLDPALVREGRFDHTIELKKLGYADFLRMTQMFGKDPTKFDFANDAEMSGAAMRAMIMETAA